MVKPLQKPMNKRKKLQTQHDERLKQKLKNIVFVTILIPATMLFAFVFFGPQISSIFGLISTYRDNGGPEDRTQVSVPIFKDPPTSVNTTSLNLTGFAEAGTTVKLFVNGPEKATTVTTSDGIFTFRDIGLIKGRNTIFARAVDQNGNESEKSQTVTVVVDSEKPKITLETPQDGDVIRNLDSRILIKGSVDKKAVIRVNDSLAIQRPDLTFELLLGVEQGELEIKVEAIDEAGNSEFIEITVTYVKGSN
jgi:bacillopeptidase F